LEAFLVSFGAVAIAEIGDKTQLLALILAVRFRAPVAVIGGIFVATVANHALAAFAGTLIASWITPGILAWLLAASFILMGLWALVPDDAPSEEEVAAASRLGAFMATATAFFLVEMGDKTQLATVALGARYEALFAVALGTTLGMMAANVPVVLFGGALSKRIPAKAMRFAAALIFIALGLIGIVTALALT
jgi:putative Ca2+/H+ antiporter (TMEM165/GDT1 family)